MFIDYSIIELFAGRGGAGSKSFRREKYVSKGGPDGGDGGRGGNIVVIGDNNLNTLKDIRYSKIYKAKNGSPGSSGRKTGKNGEYRSKSSAKLTREWHRGIMNDLFL